MKIGTLGLWHLGEIYSACLAELGHDVLGISDDKKLAADLARGVPPLEEPGLRDLLAKHLQSGRLSFSSKFSNLSGCDVLWITFDTPVDDKDRADTRIIFDALKKAVPHLKDGALIAVSSQLPVGTSARIVSKIRQLRPQLSFGYAYIPENLRLGEAVGSFMDPRRVVIGAESEAAEKIKNILGNLPAEFLTMSVASAEMVKHALNAFLGTSLSFIYDIADVAEKVGADIYEISRALKADPRIGQGAYLDASIGFSGGTLARDLQFLLGKGKAHKLKLPVIAAALNKNTKRSEVLYAALKKHLGEARGKRVTILGLTYKAGTSTLRRSLSLMVARDLSRRGVKVGAFDPAVSKADVKKAAPNIEFFRDIYSAFKNCHAVLALTPWTDIKKSDFKKIRSMMRRPALFFDARNFFRQEETLIKLAGFTYVGVGRGGNL